MGAVDEQVLQSGPSLANGRDDRLRAGAIDDVTLPHERLVRGSFVILRFALDHPKSAAALLKLSPELLDDAAPLNVKAREFVIDGLESGHFKGIPADSATLLVVGVTLVMVQDSIDRQKSVKRRIAKMIPLMAGVLRALRVGLTG